LKPKLGLVLGDGAASPLSTRQGVSDLSPSLFGYWKKPFRVFISGTFYKISSDANLESASWWVIRVLYSNAGLTHLGMGN